MVTLQPTTRKDYGHPESMSALQTMQKTISMQSKQIIADQDIKCQRFGSNMCSQEYSLMTGIQSCKR
jgi:hypothetical protein